MFDTVRERKISGPTITEIEDGSDEPQAEEAQETQQSDAPSKVSEEAESAVKASTDPKYSGENVTKTMAQCYVNMAICQAKKENWSACKRNAQEYAHIENPFQITG